MKLDGNKNSVSLYYLFYITRQLFGKIFILMKFFQLDQNAIDIFYTGWVVSNEEDDITANTNLIFPI